MKLLLTTHMSPVPEHGTCLCLWNTDYIVDTRKLEQLQVCGQNKRNHSEIYLTLKFAGTRSLLGERADLIHYWKTFNHKSM